MAAYRIPGPVGLTRGTDLQSGCQRQTGFPPGPIGRQLLQFIPSGPHLRFDFRAREPVDRIEKLETELGYSSKHIQRAKRNGMVAWDISALIDYCKSEQVLLVIRSAKPESRDYRHRRGFAAKPKEAGGESQKIKTGPKGVLSREEVERHSDFGGVWKHEYHAQSEGFYSDYDIMCAWRRSGGEYKLISEREIGVGDQPGPLIDDLNEACGWMFKHGANDYFLFVDRKRRNPPKSSDRYVVFGPNGRVYEFENPMRLDAFYKQLKLEVPYKE